MTKDPDPKPALTARASALTLFAGVVLPALTVAIEAVSRVCASVLFDPMPTPAHFAAAASVPVANLVVWRAARSGRVRSHQGLVAGWALGVTAVCPASIF